MPDIGSAHLAHPFTLAALSGYSDLPMRRMARRFGASYAVNEVVLDRSVVYPGAWQERLLTVEADDHPVGAQLMGADPKDFARAAIKLADAGYDVIDLNFGCPVAKAMQRCRGGYLLGQPRIALEIIARVIDAVGDRRPVTVKMRRAVDDSAPSTRDFFTILDGAIERGVSAVTLHGRTVEQKYQGPSDGAFLARVKRHVGAFPLLGSGDLRDAPACVAMLETTGVDGVSIARGSIGNPWIFRDCQALSHGDPLPDPPTLAEQARTIRAHLAEVRAYYGAKSAKVFLKDALQYARHHPRTKQVRLAFQNARTVARLLTVLDEWYVPEDPDALKKPSRDRQEADAAKSTVTNAPRLRIEESLKHHD